jgi:dTDP-4-amino-4,6-dideoxygalactose transaminase
MPGKPNRKVPFVDLSAQYATIVKEIDQAILKVLHGTDFILGRDVALFEQEFAAFCNAKCAVGVDSGTTALELALRAYGIGPGDQVITAANTFIATAFAISDTGARPVFVDAAPETYTINALQIESAITQRTKAIIPVHLYGQPADLDPILEISRRHGLVVIEDACQAHGARYKGKRVGSLAHAAAFSFYPAKNLGAYGDGGMLVTNDERIAESIRLLRNYGQREKYHHVVKGYNRRLDTLQAAVLRVKLKHLDKWNAARQECALAYKKLLAGGEVTLPHQGNYAEHVYHLYVIRTANRARMQTFLKERGIATGIHYPIPIHLQPAYTDLGYKKGSFPVAEEQAEEVLSLPMYAELAQEMIEYVAEVIQELVS